MTEFTTIAQLDEVQGRELASFDFDGERIAIARAAGDYYAFGDTCTHLGCSLAEGKLEGTTVICPCHGSKFDVTTGAVQHGPAREAVKSYTVRVQDAALQVQL
jgi:nitrite reductase/ring-hydroxylating ferredoxin subunit